MSDFITDVERQYELYCEIAEEHGFIDLNAKKNGFRCTTKLNEFNAGWIAFTGAVAAVRDEQQAIIDDLIYKAKLRESDHRALLVKYQATKKCWEDVGGKCEELKTQLNNMERCYIEKKKQIEQLKTQAITDAARTEESIRNLIKRADEKANELHIFDTRRDYFRGMAEGLDTSLHSMGLSDDFDEAMRGDACN